MAPVLAWDSITKEMELLTRAARELIEELKQERISHQKTAKQLVDSLSVEGCNQKKIVSLFNAIAHGDDEHKSWLKEAIDAHFNADPVPAPRGGKKSEYLLAAIQKHQADRGHGRCWENDIELYKAAGLPVPDPELPPISEHKKECDKYRAGLYNVNLKIAEEPR